MAIDQNIIKLRELTGAGILECKKALEEAGNDIEKAKDILRKSGAAKAAKRAERETSQGVVKAETNKDKTRGYIIEFNSETDFVARSEKFQEFTDSVFGIFKKEESKSVDELLNLRINNITVKEKLNELTGVIGEKLGIGGAAVVEGKTVAAYSHMGGKIGVLVALDKEGEDELAYDLALQIAATNPKYIKPEDVPAEEIEKEKDIYREQLKNEGKPADIIEKILGGKINKYFAEICLIKQEFVKNEEIAVEKLLADRGARVLKFIRFSLDGGNTSC